MAIRSDLMTRKAAAAYMGVSSSWLAHHTPERGGPAAVRLGGRIVYRVADLDHYIDHAARVESTLADTLRAAAPARAEHPPVHDRAVSFAQQLRERSDRLRGDGAAGPKRKR